MKYSIGIDIVDVKRIARLMRDHGFLKRVFTDDEIKACLSRRSPEQGLSRIFAAKEAFFKAMNLGRGVRWKDIEVGISKGKNTILYKDKDGQKAFNKKVHLTVAGTSSVAIALVVAE
ncbi:MAG: holo-ACP synthase [Deltaproteobacteria bacterium]